MSEQLRKLALVRYGKSPSHVLKEGGLFPIIGTGGRYGWASKAMFNGPAVVVPRKGSLGNPQLILESFWPVDTTFAVIPEKHVDVHWLYYSLLNFDLTKLNEATGVPSISRDWLSRIRFFNPDKEQKRQIGEILQSVDEAIERTEALFTKYQQIRAGLMHDLFTHGVTVDGKLRPPREQVPELYKETPIGWIPREWEIGRIGDLFNIQLGKMLSKASKTGRWPLVYLGNRNVQWDKVDLSNLEEMDFLPLEREKFNLMFDDLLVCEGGDVGRTAIWSGELIDCCYQKAIHRLRPKNGRIYPSYVLRYMRYAKDFGFLNNFTSQTSIAHLTREQLSKVPIIVPSPEEQVTIYSKFDTLDLKLSTEHEYLSKLIKQKYGLMHDLLTGKVPVKVEREPVEMACG